MASSTEKASELPEGVDVATLIILRDILSGWLEPEDDGSDSDEFDRGSADGIALVRDYIDELIGAYGS